MDRIAVVTGRQLIKISDIDRNLRVIAFINGQPLDLSRTARKTAADRLVDQQIIRQELASEAYGTAVEQDVDALQQQIVRDRYQGSTAHLRTALQRYGLSEQDFREQLLWQLTVLRFFDERFSPGVMVTDDEIAGYYSQKLADIRKESPRDYSLPAVSDRIRETIESQKIDKEFETWLSQMRKQTRIEYKDAAFQ